MPDCSSSNGSNGLPKSWALNLLPAVVLMAAIAFDHAGWLSFSLVPMVCVIALVAFAFLLSSQQLIGWTVIYILAIAATLWMRRGVWSGSSGNADALVATRALVAAAAGVLACLLAKSREQDRRGAREIQLILDQLEIPAITSDRDGWMVHMNPKAKELLGGGVSFGTPFFENFSIVAEKGKSILSYVDLATGVAKGPVAVHLTTGADRTRIHSAVMLRVDIGNRRRVLTLIYPGETQTPSTPSVTHD